MLSQDKSLLQEECEDEYMKTTVLLWNKCHSRGVRKSLQSKVHMNMFPN